MHLTFHLFSPSTMKKNMSSITIFLLLLSPSSASSTADRCDLSALPDPLTLRSDKITVLISGFSPSRVTLLRSLSLSYSSLPFVSSVLVLWFNPSTPPPPSLLSLSSSSISIHLHPPNSSSLSSRFLPRPQILTRSVLVCDDDVQLSPSSLSFAFRISQHRHHDSIVGFFARSHDFDLEAKSWIYTVHQDRYSIVLTKAMIVRTEYLYKYICWERLREAREYVERERNCEDILMNFLVAMETGEGPVMVEGRGGVRDYGDPRNDAIDDDDDGSASEGALSGRGDHRKKRGECIREFHRLLGEMPLRYSHGKLVEAAGEQGLCMKGGKLVSCDQQ